MRILMTTDPVGGVWNFTAGLCTEWCGSHQVALVSFGRELSPEQERRVCEMQGSCEFYSFAEPLEWMENNDQAWQGAALLQRVAEHFRPDLLHSNQFCWGALPRVGALDIPRIITAHSDVLSWAAACRPAGLEASPWLDRYRELVRQGLRGCDAVIAPTRWMLDALKANFAITCDAHVIANGARVQRSASEAPIRKLQAVSAGRLWDEAKNLRLLERLDAPMPVIVAGETGECGVGDRVQWAGILTQLELHRLFCASSVYVCPSIYEPFGLAPLEAALCGCALLLNDIASLREVWGDAALYFGDLEELEHMLDELLEEPERVLAVAARCVARASELTAARSAEAYAGFFAEVLARERVDADA